VVWPFEWVPLPDSLTRSQHLTHFSCQQKRQKLYYNSPGETFVFYCRFEPFLLIIDVGNVFGKMNSQSLDINCVLLTN
jgi:hypothetical protein